MARPLWVVSFLKKVFGLRYFGAEMTKWPLVGPVMQKVLFNGEGTGDALFYLPKDRVMIQECIEEQENTVVPSDVVTHFIEKSNYIFLMDQCICREAANCQDYDHAIGCIFLGEGVLDINPELGKMVDKETALDHVQRAPKRAGVPGRGDKIGAVDGVTPSTKLMTICNCCSCCCLFRFYPTWRPTAG